MDEPQPVLDIVRELVRENLGLGPDVEIAQDTKLVEDLKADSLDLVELTISLETRFGIEIPDEDAEDLTTVGKIADYITEHSDVA